MMQQRVGKFIFGVALTFALVSAFAADADAFVRDWLRTRDEIGPCNNSARAIASNENDETFLAVGSCGLAWNSLVIKYDADGNPKWTIPIGQVHESGYEPYVFLLPQSSGGVIVVRSIQRETSPTNFILFTEFDADGAAIWSSNHFASDDTIRIADVRQGLDGRIALALGEVTHYPDFNGRTVAVFDESGQFLWEHVLDPDNLDYQKGLSVAWGEDGALYEIITAEQTTDSRRTAHVVRFDADGTLAWSQPVYLPLDDFWYVDEASISFIDDRLFVWTTINTRPTPSDQFPLLASFDVDGNRLWQQTLQLDTNGLSGAAYGMTSDQDGNLIGLYHMTVTAPYSSGLHLAKFDSDDGAILWDVSLRDDTGLDREDALSFRLAQDHTYGWIWLIGSSASEFIDDSEMKRMTYLAYDETGTRTAFHRYPDSSESQSDRPVGATILPSGQMVVAGDRRVTRDTDFTSFPDYDADVVLVRLDANGEGTSVSTWTSPRLGTEVVVEQALVSPLGGIDIGATIDTPDGRTDMTVTHRDADGTFRWLARVGGPGSGEEIISRIVRDDDGYLYAIGESKVTENLRAIVSKFAPDGTLVWKREIPVGTDGSYNTFGMQARFDENGDLYVAGYYNSVDPLTHIGTWMAKLSPNGETVWIIGSLESDSENDDFREFIFDENGDILMLSEYRLDGEQRFQAMLRKLDRDGNVLWETTHDTALGTSIWPRQLFRANGSILVTGFVEIPPLWATFLPTIARFDDDGSFDREDVVDLSPWLQNPWFVDIHYGDLPETRQAPDGSLYWSGWFGTLGWALPAAGGFLVKGDEFGVPQSGIFIPGLEVLGWGPVNSEGIGAIDSLNRVYWGITINYVAYVAIVSPGRSFYSLVKVHDDTYITDLATVSLDEFYVAGITDSRLVYGAGRIVSARYTNPCGTTTCPWLGNCVDIGDTIPGNVCMSCEMDGGFAQFLPITNGTSCGDDGRYCNGAEECNSGLCMPAGNPCTYPQLCMEPTNECIDPIPIGQALPKGAVPTSLTPDKPVVPDVNEVMFHAWWQAAKAEAEGTSFDPALDDTDWSLLDEDVSAATSATTAAVRANEDDEAGGCGQ